MYIVLYYIICWLEHVVSYHWWNIPNIWYHHCYGHEQENWCFISCLSQLQHNTYVIHNNEHNHSAALRAVMSVYVLYKFVCYVLCMCSVFFFVCISSWSARGWDPVRRPLYFQETPSTVSTRNLAHWLQHVNTTQHNTRHNTQHTARTQHVHNITTTHHTTPHRTHDTHIQLIYYKYNIFGCDLAWCHLWSSYCMLYWCLFIHVHIVCMYIVYLHVGWDWWFLPLSFSWWWSCYHTWSWGYTSTSYTYTATDP